MWTVLTWPRTTTVQKITWLLGDFTGHTVLWPDRNSHSKTMEPGLKSDLGRRGAY